MSDVFENTDFGMLATHDNRIIITVSTCGTPEQNRQILDILSSNQFDVDVNGSLSTGFVMFGIEGGASEKETAEMMSAIESIIKENGGSAVNTWDIEGSEVPPQSYCPHLVAAAKSEVPQIG